MEKNDFLLMNELIYQTYTEPSFQMMKDGFLKRLKRVVYYDYASIMMAQSDNDAVKLVNPICNPESFLQTEQEYVEIQDIDHTEWINHVEETVIVRESDIMKDQSRLVSPIYQRCYRKHNIFDTMQMSIVYNKKIYAILTLYRTRESGTFTDDDVFYLQALSKHLNYLFFSHMDKYVNEESPVRMDELAKEYNLTRREKEIVGFIFQGMNNQEILEIITISEHTLQKHIQNIYRKFGVSSRWNLLKFK